MKWIVKKEIAELAPVLTLLLLSMIVLGGVLVPERQALEAYLWAACGVGLILGLSQSFLDHRAERDAFLRHRALSTLAVRAARSLGGIASLAACVLAPWVILALVPGSHGYDLLQLRTNPDRLGDLSFVHVFLAFGLALTLWSLARLGGSVRRIALRPFTALALPGLGSLSLVSGDHTHVILMVVIAPVVATAAVLFPAHECSASGARKLAAPAALIGLAVLITPFLDSVRWLRMPARYTLASAYPHLFVRSDGEVVMRRSLRVGDSTLHVVDQDASRKRVLFDGKLSDREYASDISMIGFPLHFESARERRLESGALWSAPYASAGDRLLALATPIFIQSASSRWLHVEPLAGRLQIKRAVPTGNYETLGTIGPDGYVEGEAPEDAARYSAGAFIVAHPSPAFVGNGAQLVIADPERRSVCFITRVQLETDFRVIEERLPADATGSISRVDQLRYTAQRQGLPKQHRDVLALMVGDNLLLLEDGSRQAEWTAVPFPSDETLWYWHRWIDPARPVMGTTLPALRDTELQQRVRATPKGGGESITTDFFLTPQDPMERAAEALFGVLAIVRPPILNTISYVAPAATDWDALESRWWLSGLIAGGDGMGWLFISLVIGVFCALRNRRQARLRCKERSEQNAWTAVGLFLGPVGMAWMAMVVPTSAIRESADGDQLAVHVPAEWPKPQPTGREVMV